jgi:L-asparaginase II
VVDANAQIVLAVGEDLTTTFRSAAKPFQLWGSLSFLSITERARVTEEQLALGAASHSGEARHIEGVRGILNHFALREEELLCGTHWPGHLQSAYALAQSGGAASAIHNNCSGKHSFMIAARRLSDAENDSDYRLTSHPVQQAIYDKVQHASGNTVVDTVVDGCGVPCFVLPLVGMARAWAFLAVQMAEGKGDLARIGWSMHRHPYLMSGSNRLDAALVDAANQPIVAKVGAEGVQCIAVPHLGLGIAIKVETGASDPRAAAVLAIMDEVATGLMDEGAMQQWLELKNWEGAVVGHRYAQWGT